MKKDIKLLFDAVYHLFAFKPYTALSRQFEIALGIIAWLSLGMLAWGLYESIR